MDSRVIAFGVSVLALSTCVKHERSAEPSVIVPAARSSGGEIEPDDADDARNADPGTGTRHVRVYVPFPDCTGNTRDGQGEGGIVEQCPCESDAPVVCCKGRAFACTSKGWAQSGGVGVCGAEGASDPVVTDGTVSTEFCRTCTRGAEGCWCRSDRTCGAALVCIENFCGRRVE